MLDQPSRRLMTAMDVAVHGWVADQLGERFGALVSGPTGRGSRSIPVVLRTAVIFGVQA